MKIYLLIIILTLSSLLTAHEAIPFEQHQEAWNAHQEEDHDEVLMQHDTEANQQHEALKLLHDSSY